MTFFKLQFRTIQISFKFHSISCSKSFSTVEIFLTLDLASKTFASTPFHLYIISTFEKHLFSVVIRGKDLPCYCWKLLHLQSVLLFSGIQEVIGFWKVSSWEHEGRHHREPCHFGLQSNRAKTISRS